MAKWATIANPLNSTPSTFGGKWGNDISRYLNGIDMGIIDSDKEPRIATTTRYEFGKLKLYDVDATHTVEIQPDNIISGSNRILRVRALTTVSDYITTDNQPATLQGKTLGQNTKLGEVLDANLNSIIKIDTIGLRDLDGLNISFASIGGSGANSEINIINNYGGILGASNITVKYGNNSKIHSYGWYSTVPGANTKLVEILSNKISTFVDIDMNGRNIVNYTPFIAPNTITNTEIIAHTTTKITTIDKGLLNTEIVYKDQPNVFGAHNQTFPSGNLILAGNGGFLASLIASGLVGNVSITLPNTTGTLAITSDPRFTDARTPLAHSTSHKTGADIIRVNELAAPNTNIPGTNATTTTNGTLRMLSGVGTEFLNGLGGWSVPTLTAGQFTGNIKGNVATASGNGTIKVFNIPHNLGVIPVAAIVKPNSVDAFGEFTTSVDGTNITITYQVAPPAGTNNLSFQWMAMDPAAGLSVTSYSTTGGGHTLVKTKTNSDLPFRSLVAGSQKITLVQNADDITFDINESFFTTSRPPTAHAITHTSGNLDALKINELAAPTANIPATNSTTTVNGTLPILHGDSSYYLNGAGQWTVPTGLGGGAGEANTVSNLAGTIGHVGLFKQKVAVNFEFKSLNVGSNKLSILDDTVNNQVVFDVNQANLVIDYSQIINTPVFVRADQGNIFGDFTQEFPSSGIVIMNSLRTFGTIIENSEITGSNQILRLPLLTGGIADTVVTQNLAQALANKTLVAPIIATIKVGAETLTLPEATDRLVGRNTADILQNKELIAPKIATIVNNNNILTLPTTADTIMGRSTTDIMTNKEINLTSNILNDSGAVAGGVPIHNGTKFVNRAKGADGTFLGVSGGVVGYYTPPTPSAGLLPDGSSIPATGRWGALWGGNLIGMGMIGFSAVYDTTSTEFISATEAATVVNTAALDDAVAYINTGGILSRQSDIKFKAKWNAKQNTGMVVRIGLSSQTALTTGGGHDSPLNNASGVMVVYVSDIETNYRVARNDGAATDVDVTTATAGGNQTAHTCEINLNSTNCTVILDGTVILNAVTTSLPANTTPLRAFLHIESIGSAVKGLSVHRAQVTML